ncbi:pentapeptide repeat-containing protein [Schaalia sp. 19OD2882]|uniref:pentapeptide repeat-containing protein n=1 Tax=Schaalia sp. 19OD2882 TaxID=2794089 RepID=UPI001C1EFA01|nr:pentapeptide repeat-containing protein [Schaalia sp. 19OD2882]QWW19534.1 pentapeptide repeat-containing protein [Schaalia sp. 19OD2882]
MYILNMPHNLGTMLTSDTQRVVGEDWSNAKVDEFAVNGTLFEDCIFDRLRVKQFNTGGLGVVTEFVNCSFEDANIIFRSSNPASFIDCSFRGARLRGINHDRLTLIDCDFREAVLRQCIFRAHSILSKHEDSNPIPNEIRGNNFSTATLVDCAFRLGVDLTLQQMPTGADYAWTPDGDKALDRVEALVNSWCDTFPEDHEEFEGWLEIWREDLQNGQHHLFVTHHKPTMSERGFAQIRQAILNT